jgi:hypothetical protein
VTVTSSAVSTAAVTAVVFARARVGRDVAVRDRLGDLGRGRRRTRGDRGRCGAGLTRLGASRCLRWRSCTRAMRTPLGVSHDRRRRRRPRRVACRRAHVSQLDRTGRSASSATRYHA